MLEMHTAAKQGQLNVVEKLLQDGVDVNRQDEHGWTALCYAAGGGHVEVIETLLRAGADASRTGADGRTPYKIALAAAQVAAARVLRTNSPTSAEPMKYCKAYPVDAVRQFQAFAKASESLTPPDPSDPDAMALAGIVFIHQDFTVTECIWHGEQVLYDEITPAWRDFCGSTLQFRVPDELEFASEYAQQVVEQGSSQDKVMP